MAASRRVAPSPDALSRWYWLGPLLALAAVTVLTWVFDLDRALAAHFYDPQADSAWPRGEGAFWLWWYRYGVVPALLMFAAGALVYAAGYARRGGNEARRAGALIMLALLVGPLLLTNGLLKNTYGRPRPRQVEAFGGDRPFVPVLMPTWRGSERSFPSGHAAAGFAPVALLFALRRRWPRLAWAAGAGGLAWGSVLGYMRMAQGGHFFSDVVWAAGLDYFAAYGVDRWLARRAVSRKRATSGGAPAPWRGRLVWTAAVAGPAVLIGVYLFRLPYFETLQQRIALAPTSEHARLAIAGVPGTLSLERGGIPGELRLRTRLDGRSLPAAHALTRVERVAGGAGEPAEYRYEVRTVGMVGAYRLHARVTLPPDVPVTIVWEELPRDDLLARWASED